MAAAPPIDIEGVQPASLDQPRVNAMLRYTADGEPIYAESELGESFNIQAFFDTGASGVLLSKETADGLAIARATHNGEEVLFEDVGVAGSEFFNVSEPLYVSLAPFGNSADIDNFATYDQVYTQTFGPLRTQVSMQEAELFVPLDVFGMPLFDGKTVVMDARPTNATEDILDLGTIRTYVYNPGTPFDEENNEEDPGIVPTDLHVDLSYANFARFTSVHPDGAPGPTLRHNPFIGPNPVAQLDPGAPADDTPGITIGHFGRTATGSFLLDTGAAASMVSQEMANGVGVFYADGTYGTDDPRLVDGSGNDIPDQFSLTIGGIGGSTKVAGFWLDSMALPTVEGAPIRYLRAPVLVADITVAEPDPNPDDGIDPPSLTLDGIFGMNFLVGSCFVDENSPLPFPEDLTAGAYDWIVFDEPNGMLGLTLRDDLGQTPPAGVVDRHVFYNNSFFDNDDPAASAADDLAVAPDKDPLLPGRTATLANFTNYTLGVNGVMVDMANLPAGRTLGADDFVIRTGTTGDPSGWIAGPAPLGVTTRPGAGAAGSDRVTLTFPDDVIRNRWVQVTVLANADTGLSSPDVFYFGNLPGDTGNPATGLAAVSPVDWARTRNNLTTSATVSNGYDFNRDGRVSVIDLGSLRGNMGQNLQLITAPAGAGAAAVASSDAVYFANRATDEESQSATQSLLAGA
ncbi:MAG TPA: hypothetical protein VFB66_29480 [Tepidisphaeraceae bacterium]|nr:hypothetical protein [Tepidisphaeraceae bacterium]